MTTAQVLHSDVAGGCVPKDRACWASWNYLVQVGGVAIVMSCHAM